MPSDEEEKNEETNKDITRNLPRLDVSIVSVRSIALDVVNDWCKKFGDVLKRFSYQPEWYHSGKDIS